MILLYFLFVFKSEIILTTRENNFASEIVNIFDLKHFGHMLAFINDNFIFYNYGNLCQFECPNNSKYYYLINNEDFWDTL